MDRAIRYSRFDILHVHEPCGLGGRDDGGAHGGSPVVGTFHAALEQSIFYDRGRLLASAVMKRVDVRVAVQ